MVASREKSRKTMRKTRSRRTRSTRNIVSCADTCSDQSGNDSTSENSNLNTSNDQASEMVYFARLARKMKKATTFSELSDILQDIVLPSISCVPLAGHFNLEELYLEEDEEATPLIPVEFSHLVASNICRWKLPFSMCVTYHLRMSNLPSSIGSTDNSRTFSKQGIVSEQQLHF